MVFSKTLSVLGSGGEGMDLATFALFPWRRSHGEEVEGEEKEEKSIMAGDLVKQNQDFDCWSRDYWKNSVDRGTRHDSLTHETRHLGHAQETGSRLVLVLVPCR